MRLSAELLISSLLLSACAAFPELDGKPVAALRAADFQFPVERDTAPAWTLDFGDPSLRRMLADADAGGLDAASARARFRAADLALGQVRATTGLGPSADVGVDDNTASVTTALRFESDLAGRFDAALRVAALEHQVSGLDLLIARRTLARAVTQGWVALAMARSEALRAAAVIEAEQTAIALLRLRRDAGEITGAELAAREQALIRARAAVVGATGAVAVAEARLRALGVQTIPDAISLRSATRPGLPAHTDLAATQAIPAVCVVWLRFHAADASRAETLAAARPRLVLTSSLSATAATLAGLISRNALAITDAVRLEGAILNNGESRRRLDQARLTVAQAEIDWLQARNQAEIAAMEAVTAAQSTQAGLDAALMAWRGAKDDLDRTRARHEAGLADALDLAEAENGVASAQGDVDRSRADAFLAAIVLHDALPAGTPGCVVTPAPAPAQSM
ncbi:MULTISPECIES: TolC family protein [unclassified Yoonia]|uniref:TolC family protein n=1 Tax=unclassified Yoonia TaxID=2629118 RepID=UPI002AFFDEF0|nr:MULTISPECIES: TolC family protein [unclassified Yoonia]